MTEQDAACAPLTQIDLDALCAELDRVERTLALLDDDDADPRQAVDWARDSSLGDTRIGEPQR